MTLAERIIQYREEHGLTQRSFARRCDLSNAQISFLERGYGSRGERFEPTFETLRKVARGMGETPEFLIAECEDFNISLKVSDIAEDDEIAYLLFNGEKVTQKQIDEVKAFARWLIERDKK